MWGFEGFNLFNVGGIVVYYIVVGIVGIIVGLFYLLVRFLECFYRVLWMGNIEIVFFSSIVVVFFVVFVVFGIMWYGCVVIFIELFGFICY